MSLTIVFDTDGDQGFTRQDTLPKADFGILSVPSNNFQTEIISLSFDTVDFNWFESPISENVSKNKNYFTINNCLFNTIYFFRTYNLQKLLKTVLHQYTKTRGYINIIVLI
jgi:hypothetical protein